MQASIQWLVRGKIGIVRAGPLTARYSKPYEYSAVFERSKYGPHKVELMALVADGRFRTAHRRVIINKVNKAFSHIVARVFWKRYP